MLKKTIGIAGLFILCVLSSGCASTEGKALSYNMTQSVARSGGDVAMTALLDEGVDSDKARRYALALAELVQSGDINKALLREKAYELALKYELNGAADYIDTLLAVIPSSVGEVNFLPAKYKDAIVSFLKDGAVRAMDLYKYPELEPDTQPEPV